MSPLPLPQPSRDNYGLWVGEVWDSIAHTKFTVTYRDNGLCQNWPHPLLCPIPTPRYQFDPVQGPGMGMDYLIGVYDSFKVCS